MVLGNAVAFLFFLPRFHCVLICKYKDLQSLKFTRNTVPRGQKSSAREERERERERAEEELRPSLVSSLVPGDAAPFGQMNETRMRNGRQSRFYLKERMNEVDFIRSSTPRMDATPLGRMNEIQMINGCSSRFSFGGDNG